MEGKKKQQETNLLDLHAKPVDQDQMSGKQRKKIIKGIKRSLSRQGAFRHTSNHIGKGEKRA